MGAWDIATGQSRERVGKNAHRASLALFQIWRSFKKDGV
jgi:hypothetical protein